MVTTGARSDDFKTGQFAKRPMQFGESQGLFDLTQNRTCKAIALIMTSLSSCIIICVLPMQNQLASPHASFNAF